MSNQMFADLVADDSIRITGMYYNSVISKNDNSIVIDTPEDKIILDANTSLEVLLQQIIVLTGASVATEETVKNQLATYLARLQWLTTD